MRLGTAAPRLHGAPLMFSAVGLKAESTGPYSLAAMEASGQKRPKCIVHFPLFQSTCLNQIQIKFKPLEFCSNVNKFDKM
jgi:hypothetical protein